MTRRFLPTTALRSVLVLSLLVAAYSGLAVWKEQSQYARFADFPSGLEAAISLVIGLMLAFRANRAFDRWWEGRTLWGTLVNASRNLAVKANNVVGCRDESFVRFHQLLVAFPCVLRDHLRDGANAENVPALSGERFDGQHLPSWVVNLDRLCKTIQSSVDEIFATETMGTQLTNRSTGAAVGRKPY